MHFTVLDYTLQAAGFVGHGVLFWILLARRLARQFPQFVAFVIFQLARTLILIPIMLTHSYWPYLYAYEILNIADVGFSFAVIYGIGSSVFRPLGVWAPDVRGKVALFIAAGVIVAAALTLQTHPPDDLRVDRIVDRGEFFVSVLMLELFAMIWILSSSAGLAWRHHVRRIADAFAVYSAVFVAIQWLHSSDGSESPAYIWITRFRILIYFLVLLYWIVTLFFPEPARCAIPAAQRAAIFSLRGQLAQRLRRIGTRKT